MDDLIEDLARGLFRVVSDLCLLAVILVILGTIAFYLVIEPYRNHEYELLALETVLFLAGCAIFRRARDWYAARKLAK